MATVDDDGDDEHAAAAASTRVGETNETVSDDLLPDPDEVNLDLTFDDIMDESSAERAASTMSLTAEASSAARLNGGHDGSDEAIDSDDDDDLCCGKAKGKNSNEEINEEEYILGTLIVRVVAARDLSPVVNGGLGGVGGFLFGGGGGGSGGGTSSKNRRRGGGGARGGADEGTTNPYASCRFGNTTQRTSEVFDSVNPTWPRGETMYMDVVHPAFTDRLEEKEEQQPSSTSATPTPTPAFDFEASLSSGVAQATQQQQQQQQQQQHPGDPPTKAKKATLQPPSASEPTPSQPVAAAAAAVAASSSSRRLSSKSSSSSSSRNKENKKDEDEPRATNLPEKPILTIAIFHASEIGKLHKYNPTKGGAAMSGDSDDVFLGMAAVDLTTLLTGKTQTLDAWLPLSGTPDEHGHSSVRIVCEYEASDDAPRPGDMVRFTGYCHAADLYPFHAGKLYKVVDPNEHKYHRHGDNRSTTYDNSNGDMVLISWTSPEQGWVSSVWVHRFMLVCEDRAQHKMGPVEFCEQELATLTERLVHSPMVHVVQDAVERLPEDGIAALGQNIWNGGASLLQRWVEGGLDTAIHDVIHATNVDGHANPQTDESVLDTEDMEDDDDDILNESDENINNNIGSHVATSSDGKLTPKKPPTSHRQQQHPQLATLPNMPACPITGQAMVDPVVAADGHTYERSAIARWLKTSDKSPLTGSDLAHKNLVPNFMLVSSLQEAAASAQGGVDVAYPKKKEQQLAAGTVASSSPLDPQQQQEEHANTSSADNSDVEDLVLDDEDLLIDEELS